MSELEWPLRRAIRWANGMVTCFNWAGRQIPELQGPYGEVRQAVLDAAGEAVVFQHGDWANGAIRTVSREEW